MGKAELAFRTPRRFARRARGREAALERARASAAFHVRRDQVTQRGQPQPRELTIPIPNRDVCSPGNF